jgi:hypothetical protein
MTSGIGHRVIASEAKQSSCAPAGALNEEKSQLQMPRFLFCALRARWIASSLRSSQ